MLRIGCLHSQPSWDYCFWCEKNLQNFYLHRLIAWSTDLYWR